MTITRDVTDGIAMVRIDDGKVNAFGVAAFAELDRVLDACADDRAVVLCGRPGVFTAGLDRAVLDAPADEVARLAVALTHSTMRLWLEPRPVVAAVTGHAIAAGTILAMACDHAVAADGDYRWGLNETAIGLLLPQWVVDLARANLRADWVDRLVLPGRLVDPGTAVEVGYADELAEPDAVVGRARDRAVELAALPRVVYAANKRRLRGVAADAALAALEVEAPVLQPGTGWVR